MNQQQKIILLKAQITLFPALSDADLLAQLKTKNIPVHIDFETRKFDLYLMSKGLWILFKNDISDAVVTARDALTAFSPVVDIKNNYGFFTMMIQGLVDDVNFPFTAIHQAEVLAMVDSQESWARQNIPDLTEGDIARARL